MKLFCSFSLYSRVKVSNENNPCAKNIIPIFDDVSKIKKMTKFYRGNVHWFSSIIIMKFWVIWNNIWIKYIKNSLKPFMCYNPPTCKDKMHLIIHFDEIHKVFLSNVTFKKRSLHERNSKVYLNNKFLQSNWTKTPLSFIPNKIKNCHICVNNIFLLSKNIACHTKFINCQLEIIRNWKHFYFIVNKRILWSCF